MKKLAIIFSAKFFARIAIAEQWFITVLLTKYFCASESWLPNGSELTKTGEISHGDLSRTYLIITLASSRFNKELS